MADPSSLRLVVFRLGSVICGASATIVREVIGFERATRVPGSAATVCGLVNYRGRLLTVVDGRRAVGSVDDARPTAEAVLVLVHGERLVGLAVDEVLDLAFVDLEPGSDGVAGVDPALVQGVARFGKERVVILDTGALFTPVV